MDSVKKPLFKEGADKTFFSSLGNAFQESATQHSVATSGINTINTIIGNLNARTMQNEFNSLEKFRGKEYLSQDEFDAANSSLSKVKEMRESSQFMKNFSHDKDGIKKYDALQKDLVTMIGNMPVKNAEEIEEIQLKQQEDKNYLNAKAQGPEFVENFARNRGLTKEQYNDASVDMSEDDKSNLRYTAQATNAMKRINILKKITPSIENKKKINAERNIIKTVSRKRSLTPENRAWIRMQLYKLDVEEG